MTENTLDVHNPITNELIGTIPIHTHEVVQMAVEKARVAQRAWGGLSVEQRGRILRRWGDMIWYHRQKAIEIIRAETGKTETSAWQEVLAIDNITEYYFRHGPKILRPQTRRSALPLVQRTRVYHKPHGVIGLITPWNYPFLLPFIDMIPALIAGNAVVIKPSEITPFSAIYGVNMLIQAGVPVNVVQIVHGDGQTGAALVDMADYIGFTGSTAVGRTVGMRAAARLIPYSLELGGKDPCIVMQGADLDRAAAGALLSALENAGQTCVSTERVYVEATVYEPFVERVLGWAHQLNMGGGDGWDVHIGSLTNERELLRIEEQIADAVAKGAQILYGGKRRPDLGPLFYEPTVLVNVDHSMLVMQEETFGPLLPIMAVADIDEAVHWANDNQYGLSACIFAGSLRVGERLATRLDTGDVTINRPLLSWASAAAPMGGQKNSGVGRRNGPEGLKRFVSTQSITLDAAHWLLPQGVVHTTPILRTLVKVRRALLPFAPFLRP